MEYISIDKYLKLLIKRWKIILYFTLAFAGLAILYGIIFYSPTYESKGKILIKQEYPNTFVIELNSGSDVASTLGQNKNPILTQIEIMNSYDMASIVASKLSKEIGFSSIHPEMLTKIIQSHIKLDNPPSTDIIEVNVSWNNPNDAQKIAKLFMDTYYNYNESLYKKSISKTKLYIEKQLKDTSEKLSSVRDQIENYRKQNSSINIDLEAGNVIDQIGRIENLLSDTNVNIASADKKVDELSKNLGVNLKSAIASVALGQSEHLVKLNQNLTDDQQKLASLIIKYPANTPQVKVLTSEINEIKSQIRNETLTLIGNKQSNIKKPVIADTVRSQMVSDYVKNNVELKSLLSQRDTLQTNLNALKASQRTLPEVQKNLQTLQENEKTLSTIVETLNAKLVEAKIKETAIISGVNIVESPILPVSESFPTMLHIFIIFLFFGILFGIAIILSLYYIEDICDGPNELEEILKAPTLGIIPWLANSAYNNFLNDYNPHSVVAIIYQKIATSLKIKCYKKHINSIGIISAEFEKRRSIVAASLANTMAKTNDKVILIDTDFRDGSLTREFYIDFSQYPDITDLIMELSKNTFKEANLLEIVKKYIIQIPAQENLFLIPNNNKIENPYEILNNEVFPMLINCLKSYFNFVIFDAPSMLAVADSIITSQYLDGLVILCGIKTSRSNLRKIKKICDDNYVEILGSVARNTLTELEVPENMYVKQLSANTEMNQE